MPGVRRQAPLRVSAKKVWLTYAALARHELDFDFSCSRQAQGGSLVLDKFQLDAELCDVPCAPPRFIHSINITP